MTTLPKTTASRRSTSTTRRSASTKSLKTKTPKETSVPKPEADPDIQVTAPVESVADMPESVELRKKELIDLVVARSGVKKRDAKPAVEAMLAILGEALADQRDMNLQPMGKVKIARVKQAVGAQVLVARIRRRGQDEKTSPDPLEHAAE